MYSGSSLIDLKAELSRKEEQVFSEQKKSISKYLNNGKKTFEKIHEMTGKRKKRKIEEKMKEESNDETEEAGCSSETSQLIEKARIKLEAKSKIYDKLQTGEMADFGNIHGETKFLVDFHKKYMDIEKLDTTEGEAKAHSAPSALFEADENYRERLREKWDKEQTELLEGPVHYENIKFDEVRELGTGYYAFSKNEEERQKQMEELEILRKETKNMQNKKGTLENKRKAALKERMNKIKQRKLGINPDRGDIFDQEPVTSLSHHVSHELKSSVEEIGDMNSCKQLLPDVDNMLQECRKASTKEREWDRSKKPGFINKQYFVAQKQSTTVEKIVQERRDERAKEFEPPAFY